jgi:hypothetical protein
MIRKHRAEGSLYHSKQAPYTIGHGNKGLDEVVDIPKTYNGLSSSLLAGEV